jgi:hypothetical protein
MDERWVYLPDPIRVNVQPIKPLVQPNPPNKKIMKPKEYTIFVPYEDAEQEWLERVNHGIVF